MEYPANGIRVYTGETRLRGLKKYQVLRIRKYMRANFTQLYLHYVWATWDRLPLITPEIQQLVYAAIIKECEELKCTVIAIGGIEDHVHLLTGFPTTVSVSEVIKQAKGSSSHFINHEIKPKEFFKWQGSYGAFTVSYDAIDTVANYIRNQQTHHQQKSLISTWELTPETNEKL